ncbi:rhodanese-like domain-containing protein [Acidiphilium sp.]|uniref:rhodanese-like domain-containing protein n=1 Tax=Acidiphilium sp. TaxID=527 RepID=UPI003CFFC8A0
MLQRIIKRLSSAFASGPGDSHHASSPKKLSPAEAVAFIASSDTVFVDVRERAELDRSGTIKGAIHAPRGNLPGASARAGAKPGAVPHPDMHLILFCASGMRATFAAKTVMSCGYQRVSLVSGGGFDALKRAGAPTTR